MGNAVSIPLSKDVENKPFDVVKNGAFLSQGTLEVVKIQSQYTLHLQKDMSKE